jgi:hypothetical protein
MGVIAVSRASQNVMNVWYQTFAIGLINLSLERQKKSNRLNSTSRTIDSIEDLINHCFIMT